MFRCAIVGCGARAAGHADAYGEISHGTLVACCDLDPERRDAFADRYEIPSRYASLDDLLAREKPDLVHLVTKPSDRVPLLRRLSDAGVPAVLVEKPVCVDSGDYLDLRVLSRDAAGTKIAVNHQLRHHRTILEFLDIVRSGGIGGVRMIDASSGLPLAGQGVHMLDLMLAFAGHPDVATVVGMASGYDDIDGTHPSPKTATAVATFVGGIRGVLHAGEGYPVHESDDRSWMHKRIAVYGTRGFLHWRMAGWERSEPDGTVAEGSLDYAAEDQLAQARLTEALFDWIEDDARAAPTNLVVSLDEWRVALALYESVLEQRPVAFPFEPSRGLVGRYAMRWHD